MITNLPSRLDARGQERRHQRALIERLPSPELRRSIREAFGASQEDVARQLGVTREAVTRWESGARTPRGDLLRSYVAVLDHMEEQVARVSETA